MRLLSSHMPLPHVAGATFPQHAGSVRHSSRGSQIPFPSFNFLFACTFVYMSKGKCLTVLAITDTWQYQVGWETAASRDAGPWCTRRNVLINVPGHRSGRGSHAWTMVIPYGRVHAQPLATGAQVHQHRLFMYGRRARLQHLHYTPIQYSWKGCTGPRARAHQASQSGTN